MDLFKLFGTIAINNENANKNIEEVTRLAEDARDKISTGFGNIGRAAVGMGKLIGGALIGSGAIGGALMSVTESTMEYRTAMGKLDAAFITAGHSAETATATYNGLVRVLGDTDVAVEASNHLALLCDNEQDLQTWTNICTGVFATFGDSLPIEGLTEAANETAKVGQVTGPLADALNWAGISEDAFNASLSACTTEQERQQLIMETLNGVYDDASQRYQEMNADVIAANEAQEKFSAAMASFGETAQPIVNAIRDGLGTLLLALTDLVASADFSAIEAGISSAFSWLIDNVVPAVSDFVNFVLENKEPILAVIAGVAAGFVAWNVVSIVQGVISAIQAWKLATEGMTIAQKLLNLAMSANPIGIIITVIAALVAAFIVLWNNCEGFRNFFINMWESIKVAFAAVVEWLGQAIDSIVQWFRDAWAWIQEAWSSAGEFFQGVWDGICSAFSAVGTWFSEKFTAAKEGIQNAWSNVTDFFQGVWDGVCGVFDTAKDVMNEKLSNMRTAYEEHGGGIQGAAAALFEGVKGYYTAGYDFINNLTGGKLGEVVAKFKEKMTAAKEAVVGKLEEIKTNFTNKLNAAKTTVTNIFNAIKTAIQNPIETAKTIVQNAINAIKGFFNFTISWPHIPMPHFSISPSGWKIGDLLKGSIPSLGIEWYAKAMENPMLMENPTVFGMNPESGKMRVGGEAGSEVVSGTDKLMSMIEQAVENKMTAYQQRIIELLGALVDGNVEMLKALLAGHTIVLNKREVARTVREYA
jgi:phage-related protein